LSLPSGNCENEMKAEDQRIALATAFPTVFVRPMGQSGWNYFNSIVGRVLPCIDGDILRDMNAMAEAEKLLRHPEAYSSRLGPILLRDKSVSQFDGTSRWYFAFTHANAAQRAEAVLHTIGLWTDTDPKAREGG